MLRQGAWEQLDLTTNGAGWFQGMQPGVTVTNVPVDHRCFHIPEHDAEFSGSILCWLAENCKRYSTRHKTDVIDMNKADHMFANLMQSRVPEWLWTVIADSYYVIAPVMVWLQFVTPALLSFATRHELSQLSRKELIVCQVNGLKDAKALRSIPRDTTDKKFDKL